MQINKEAVKEDIAKIPGLLFAFVYCAYGISQIKNVGIGMHSWATLTSGLVHQTGMNFGRINQLIGLTIILFSLTLKIYPGIGTILNMYFIGLYIDFIDKYNLTFTPQNYILKIIVLFWGLTIFSYGIYSYLKYDLGAGPRDGLMVGLVKITGLSVRYIKPAIEITVLLLGFFLGGTVGLGTIIVTFCGGYILDKIFKWKDFNPKQTSHRKFTDYFVYEQLEKEDLS